MAKNAKIIKEVSDFNVEIADNGFVLTYSGKTEDDDWVNSKVVITSVDDLVKTITDIVSMEK
jgi:hypothetical protein